MASLVCVHIWKVPTTAIPQALARMVRDRPPVRALRFGKLLGTASGDTFAIRDLALTRWALLTGWDDAATAEGFERSRVIRGWDAIADERIRFRLRVLRSRGSWSREQPFTTPPVEPAWSGPVAAITRARLRPPKAVAFWRAIPPVARALHDNGEALFTLGFGEAPVGWQGTFSIWPSTAALRAFAYRHAAHARVIERAASERWYAEELFARFAVLAADGTVDGRTLTGGEP